MATSDDLGRAAGSGVPIRFGDEDLVLPAITMEIIGEVRQYLLSLRKSPQQVFREFVVELGDLLTPEDKEKMLADSLKAARELNFVRDEELQAYLNSTEGLAMVFWLAFERRYPGKFTRDDVAKIMMSLGPADVARMFELMDQASGMGDQGNSTGRTETQGE